MDTLKEEQEYLRYKNEYVIDVNKPYIIRLDGRKFSKLNKCCLLPDKKKPYDDLFEQTMKLTLRDVMSKFGKDLNCLTAYTFSDEISLVCYPKAIPLDVADDNPYHHTFFGGRVFKLISVVSGYIY